MSKIHFFNFANGSSAKQVECLGYTTTDAIAKLAKKHCGLGSRGIDACYDENADLKAAITGTVFAGLRAVGRFRVID